MWSQKSQPTRAFPTSTGLNLVSNCTLSLLSCTIKMSFCMHLYACSACIIVRQIITYSCISMRWQFLFHFLWYCVHLGIASVSEGVQVLVKCCVSLDFIWILEIIIFRCPNCRRLIHWRKLALKNWGHSFPGSSSQLLPGTCAPFYFNELVEVII